METGEIPPGTKPLPCASGLRYRPTFVIIIMCLKLLLAKIRWGSQLTERDILFVKGLTLLQVVKSSYLLPKSLELRSTNRLPRW